MASVFSHAVAGLSIGTCFYQSHLPRRIWIAGAICSALPDVDVVGFRYGIHYGDFWGHRGFTHSLTFACLVAGVAALICGKNISRELSRLSLVLYFFLSTASHGVLDAMTNGGLGVAFFSPFDNTRYFLPWRPIRVSPLAVGSFFGQRGYLILQNEFLWIWLPSVLFVTLVLIVRRWLRFFRSIHNGTIRD